MSNDYDEVVEILDLCDKLVSGDKFPRRSLSRHVESAETILANSPSLSGCDGIKRRVAKFKQLLTSESTNLLAETKSKVFEEIKELSTVLRGSAQVNRDIVRGDTKNLTKASDLAQKNYESLKDTVLRGKEASSVWSSAMVGMLVLSLLCFVGIVLFIKLFPRR